MFNLQYQVINWSSNKSFKAHNQYNSYVNSIIQAHFRNLSSIKYVCIACELNVRASIELSILMLLWQLLYYLDDRIYCRHFVSPRKCGKCSTLLFISHVPTYSQILFNIIKFLILKYSVFLCRFGSVFHSKPKMQRLLLQTKLK